MLDPAIPSDRVLLCLPFGGINDTLCQIEKCWQYADRFDRRLVIDAQRSGLLGHFSDFFSPRQVRRRRAVPGLSLFGSLPGIFSAKGERPLPITRLSSQDLATLDHLTCRPAAAQGRLASFKVRYAVEKRQFCETISGEPLTFDFGHDHAEPLLVHAQCGGGTLSAQLLRRVTLSRPVQAHVARRLALLPARYIGIHVRNTDHQTDYGRLFESVAARAAGRTVLVCSDDADVIAHARAFFSRSTVVTVSDTPQTNQRPLHRKGTWKGDPERRIATTAALTDLLALGSADELFFANVKAGHPSGFSLLARHLANNKPLIAELLSAPAD